MAYTVDDIAIKKLEEEDLEALADFCSSYSDLEEFLKDDAFRDQSVNVSVTYLVYDREERLLAYITLLSDSLRIKRDEELREHFRDLGIYYPYLPALKIGRLCIRDEYWRNNLGTLLLRFAVRVAWEISERCGCRFVTIDAKNHGDGPIDFYRDFGFTELTTKTGDTVPMYLDILTL